MAAGDREKQSASVRNHEVFLVFQLLLPEKTQESLEIAVQFDIDSQV